MRWWVGISCTPSSYFAYCCYAWHSRNRKLLFIMLPFYTFLCMAPVYIQPHYLIHALAGWLYAAVFYFLLMAASKNMK